MIIVICFDCMNEYKNETMNAKKPVSFTIIFENDDFAVLNKKQGIPTAPLKIDDFSVLTEFLSTREMTEHITGKKAVEAGLLHRLDTATSGIILIAKRQKIYDALQHMQELDLIEKEYTAICDFLPQTILKPCFPKADSLHLPYSFDISSYFVPFGKGAKKVKAIFDLTSYLSKKKHKTQLKKPYITHITISNYEKGDIICTCRLTQGYRHQVRCHLSSIGMPIKGDGLYNVAYIEEHKERITKEVQDHSYPLELKACKISFPSPYLPLSSRTERLSFSLPIQDRKNL